MVAWDSGSTLADRFRAHARDAQHLYGWAMRGMADDWDAGGPMRTVCRGDEDAARGSAIQLRLLAGVFRLVLTGQAEELRPYYPRALELPPQTNETVRTIGTAHRHGIPVRLTS